MFENWKIGLCIFLGVAFGIFVLCGSMGLKALALILVASLALVYGQDDGAECECGMFITTWSDEWEVHRLPPFDIDNCQAVDKCNNKCAQEYKTYTNGGDLNHMLDSGYTVGQIMCLNVYVNYGVEHIHYETVYGYARHCNGPWDYDGQFSMNRLCCYQGQNFDCDAVTGVPSIH